MDQILTHHVRDKALVWLMAAVLLVTCTSTLSGAESQWVYRGATGRLVYVPDAQGDRILDFSDVGYQGGKSALPHVPTSITVSPVPGDDTATIQAAIDQVASLPVGPDGFRGAVELSVGDYQIGTHLEIRDSGVVLRGSGNDAGGTVLHATGTSQRSLIQVFGSGSQSLTGSTRSMIDKTVPVGSRSFRVDSTAGFTVGDTVRVERPSTANWISDLGMDMIPPRDDGGTVNQWQAGSFNLRYDRVITRIEGDRIFVDAPLANAFEQQYGGGLIRRYTWTDRIENVGVENLRAESEFASATDEDHSWNFVEINKAQNVWVRDTVSAHFARSAVLSNPEAKWVTVDNATNLTPKSQITGGRRYTFDLSGQLDLVTNSEANEGRHDFVNNSTRPPGPHVFHNSIANNALDEAGPHQRWATGSLFDNIVVDGDQINARNRGNFGSGHGWAGANMVIWNSTADSYIVQNPPTAQNWLVGSSGTVIDDQTFGPQPPGYIDSHGQAVDVSSLYEAQLDDAADVSEFQWGGEISLWTNPDAWRERLAPGLYSVEMRDYLIGDVDDYVDDGSNSVDDAFIDPSWESVIQGSSALPITGFDVLSGNQNVAFTIQHKLDAGERVVHGSLALALKQSGGVVDTDFIRLFDFDANHRLSFSDLGWDTQINPSDSFVGVVDLGLFTDQLQSGSVNVQVNDDVGVDWALYNVTVAKQTGTSDQAAVSISAGGESIIASDVGAVASLRLGDATPGTLSLCEDGELLVSDDYVQSPLGQLKIEVGSGGAAGNVTINGDTQLDGTLALLIANDYTPAYGDSFELITFNGSVDGSFDQAILPSIGGGLVWSLMHEQNSVLAVVSLKGDYNGDGSVDAADYTTWRDTYGSTTLLQADGDGNGVVDMADYTIWVDAFGSTATSQTSATPEPSALLLVCISLLSAQVGMRRLRK